MTAPQPEPSRVFSPVAAGARLVAMLACTLLMMAPVWAAQRFFPRLHRPLAFVYWRMVCFVLGFRIRVHGVPSRQHPTLFVANHASYLDIPVLGSLVQGAFVAKSEVGTWPGIKILARLGGTVFVARQRQGAGKERNSLLERLQAGGSLILFPEGTSNDGNRVLPFKSALMSVAEVETTVGQPLAVQPISVAYTRLDGLPIGLGWRQFLAWYGDMDLAPHCWAVLGMGRITVDVVFHPVTTIAAYKGRKGLTEHCHTLVARGVVLANAGRLDRLPAAQPEAAPEAVAA